MIVKERNFLAMNQSNVQNVVKKVTDMQEIKSYTDLEQSKNLAKILPLESADMCYPKDAFAANYDKEPVCHYNGIGLAHPCWSLVALLSVLPILERKGYQKAKPQLLYDVAISKWIVDSHVYTTNGYDNSVDACYEMIIHLHELNLL